MKLFKIINARIRTTERTYTVWDGYELKKKTDVTYRPQIQYKFLWFTWWMNIYAIECESYRFVMNQLLKHIEDNCIDKDMTKIDYEYIKI